MARTGTPGDVGRWVVRCLWRGSPPRACRPAGSRARDRRARRDSRHRLGRLASPTHLRRRVANARDERVSTGVLRASRRRDLRRDERRAGPARERRWQRRTTPRLRDRSTVATLGMRARPSSTVSASDHHSAFARWQPRRTGGCSSRTFTLEVSHARPTAARAGTPRSISTLTSTRCARTNPIRILSSRRPASGSVSVKTAEQPGASSRTASMPATAPPWRSWVTTCSWRHPRTTLRRGAQSIDDQ